MTQPLRIEVPSIICPPTIGPALANLVAGSEAGEGEYAPTKHPIESARSKRRCQSWFREEWRARRRTAHVESRIDVRGAQSRSLSNDDCEILHRRSEEEGQRESCDDS